MEISNFHVNDFDTPPGADFYMEIPFLKISKFALDLVQIFRFYRSENFTMVKWICLVVSLVGIATGEIVPLWTLLRAQISISSVTLNNS